MKKRRILVTAALPYANGPLHLGHLAGAYLPADIFVRYQRMKGHDVLFICGTDEHGVPISIRAEKEGVTPKEIVERYHHNIKDSFDRLNIIFDNFSGTAREIHYKTSQDFFTTLINKGHIDKRQIKQLFCQRCNRFLPDRFVEGECPHCHSKSARSDQCDLCGKWLEELELLNPRCKICTSEPVVRESSHWFFKLSSFQKSLQEWLGSKPQWKPNVLNYCRGWFDSGLKDRAITRDLNWGVPVPLKEADGKVLYVWFDAPIGYISSTKEWAKNQGREELWKDYWLNPDTELIHFIGKDNIIFHAILFPAMLMGYGGYILPKDVAANEFLNLEGRQLSTSKNWAVWAPDYLAKFPVDPLRYYIAKNAPETKDADFAWKEFQAKNNNELADILGNFVNRTVTFIHRYFDGRVPEAGTAEPDKITAYIENLPSLVGDNIERYQIRAAVEQIMAFARECNRYFDENQPWVTRKSEMDKCRTTMNVCMRCTAALASVLYPVLPSTSGKILAMLNLGQDVLQKAEWDDGGRGFIGENQLLGKAEILFQKIEDETIEEELEKFKK